VQRKYSLPIHGVSHGSAKTFSEHSSKLKKANCGDDNLADIPQE
jgi:hypothetical protein